MLNIKEIINGILFTLVGNNGVGLAAGSRGFFVFRTVEKWPVVWPILIAVMITVPVVLLTIFSGKMFFLNIRPQWLFPYNLSWTLIFLAGTWWLIQQGRRKGKIEVEYYSEEDLERIYSIIMGNG